MAVSPAGEALLQRFKDSASKEAELKEAVKAEFGMIGQNEMRALETRASSSPLEEVPPSFQTPQSRNAADATNAANDGATAPTTAPTTIATAAAGLRCSFRTARRG